MFYKYLIQINLYNKYLFTTKGSQRLHIIDVSTVFDLLCLHNAQSLIHNTKDNNRTILHLISLRKCPKGVSSNPESIYNAMVISVGQYLFGMNINGPVVFIGPWNPKLYLLTVSHSEQIFVVGSSWYFTKCIFGTSVIFLRQLQCCILQSNNVVLEVANENGDRTYNFCLILTNL